MRDIHECTAEVFRRMEKGIRERRRRRSRMLACGIPLCVCLALCAAAFLPAMGAGNAQTEVVNTPLTAGETGLPSVRVERMDSGQLLRHYEGDAHGERIRSLNRLIGDLLSGETMDAAEDDKLQHYGTDEPADAPATDCTKQDCVYLITCIGADGAAASYRLQGDVLLDVEKNTKVKLPLPQLIELRSVLGLTE